MKENQAEYPVATLCRVLGVSPSGYYAWCQRGPSARQRKDRELVQQIRAIHQKSRGTYGAPRVHAELSERGVRTSRKRVARLMSQAGVAGVSRRRRVRTTKRSDKARPAPDLVQRRFVADRPDRLWLADITYIRTWSGFLYLAVVLDVFSRRVVGWAMATHLRTELVLEALNMAIWRRRPQRVVHHSDHGSQYTSVAFGERCDKAGIRLSMGSVGDCYDNAMCESFFASLETELLDRCSLRTPAEAELAVFDYIEGFYNPYRRHSALGQLSPINYERRHSDVSTHRRIAA